MEFEVRSYHPCNLRTDLRLLERHLMLGVTIHINGRVIYARTAVNRSQEDEHGRMRYEVDTGEFIRHNPADGAVPLAKKLLDTIKEQR